MQYGKKFCPISFSSCCRNDGFSLIELLMVVIIIGLLMSLIIPSLIAARIEARHELVRQSCSELTGTVQQWIQKSMVAQDGHRSIATISDYVASLADRKPADDFMPPIPKTGQWIATAGRPNNWNNNNIDYSRKNQRKSVKGRWAGKKINAPPESVVEDFIPGEKVITNPFSSENIFDPVNDPLTQNMPIPGAIAFCSITGPGTTISYGFCFQGHESTTVEWDKESTFQGRQNLTTLQGFQYCTLFAQFR